MISLPTASSDATLATRSGHRLPAVALGALLFCTSSCASLRGPAGPGAPPAEQQSIEGLPKEGIAHRAPKAPVLDGEVDPVWSRSQRFRLDRASSDQPPTTPDDISGEARVLWDEANLYLLIDLVDDRKKGFVDVPAPHHSDQCEVYVYAGEGFSARQEWDYGGPLQYAYEVFREPAMVKPTWKGDQTTHRYGIVDTERGWRAELALPFAYWTGFEARPDAALGLEIHCNDNDDSPTRENHINWSDYRDLAWTNPSVIGRVVLGR